jgi:hypothetical protein
MIISAVNATSDVGTTGPCKLDTTYPATILSEGMINVTCTPASFASSLGNKVKVDFTITYTAPGGSLSQVAGGSVYAQVQ